jgi:hypothetical protein
MVANLAFLATHTFETGEQPQRTGNDHALVVAVRAVRGVRRTGRDRAVERPGLLQAARRARPVAPARPSEFRTNRDRFERRAAINALVERRSASSRSRTGSRS